MAQLTIEQALQIAIQHHQAGKLSQAESAYQQILNRQRNHPDALHLLGVIAQQQGRNQLAVELIRRAVEQRKNWPEALFNLGIVLNTNGQLAQAAAAYQQAIALRPNWPQAYYNLSNTLRSNGQANEAITAIRRAIQLSPNYAEAHNNLGTALREIKQWTKAIASFKSAIQSKPDYAQAYCNLGVCLQNQKQTQDAIAVYRQAIALKPDFADAHSNLGLALREMRDFDQAVLTFQRAIKLQPHHAGAYNNLGLTQQDLGLLDQAINAHRHAIQLSPNSPEFYAALGSALVLAKQVDEGIAAYRQSLLLRPNFPQALNNLAIVLMNMGEAQESLHLFRLSSELQPENASIGSAQVFAMLYHPAYNPQTIFDAHARWNKKFAQPLQQVTLAPLQNTNADRRLRIGYVSPDFRQHPVAQFLLPILENHDRKQFEVFCYSDVRIPDSTTVRCEAHADRWLSICDLSHDEVANQIRGDEIDILVDLAGHSTANRLLVFARKPARVQVSYLGYPCTTGLTAIDYRLTDPWADPVRSTDSYHTEVLYRLPQTNWCFAQIQNSPEITPVPFLKNGYLTFGSFNNLAKVTDETLRLWAQILRKVPHSRLLMKASALTSAHACERIIRTMADNGISSDRIKLIVAKPDYISHLATYNEVDIALDTFPYNGTTTTCEALWMGVPVVTLSGDTHRSRVGFSLLTNVDMPQLIATTSDRYIDIAVAVANDLNSLQTVRRELRTQMQNSPLMNGPAFAIEIESAYRHMWKQHLNA